MSVTIYNRDENQARQSVDYLYEILCAIKKRWVAIK